MERDLLQDAPTLLDLASLPVGSLVSVDIGRPHVQGAVERFAFYLQRVPHPEGHWQTREWARVRRDGRLDSPYSLYGACALGGMIGESEVIRRGVGLTFARLAVFRNGGEAPPGFEIRPDLPNPEELDCGVLSMLLSIGQVASGADGMLRWRLPWQVYNTGPVVAVAVTADDVA